MIKITQSDKEKKDFDQLLFDVLWRSLNMERNARQTFKLDKPETELVAIEDNQVVGGIVANWLIGGEVEIHHMALASDFQGQGLGKQLVEKLTQLAKEKSFSKLSVYARNTSKEFYAKLGFKETGECVQQCDLIRHGISCHKMIRIV